MEMKLKLFHDAKAPLANGHKRDSLLMMSDEEFESNHGFIQWAFPTAEKSNHNFNAPVLDLDSAIWLAEPSLTGVHEGAYICKNFPSYLLFVDLERTGKIPRFRFDDFFEDG